MSDNMITLPLLPLRGMLIFPGMLVNLDIGRDKSIHAVENAAGATKQLLLTTQKDAAVTDVQIEDLYTCGVLAEIKQLLKLPNGAVRILVEGLERVRLDSITVTEGEDAQFVGSGELIRSEISEDTEIEALRRMLIETFENWVLLTKKVSSEVLLSFKAQPDPGRVADMIAGYLSVSIEEKQRLLEAFDVKERMHSLYVVLSKELEIAGLEKNIAAEVRRQIEKISAITTCANSLRRLTRSWAKAMS